jgi:copper chaperone CopZ
MTSKTYQLERLTCPSCVLKIKAMMKRTKGVKSSNVMFMASKLKVTFDESIIKSEEIKRNLDKLGFKVLAEI